jgi:hypothetical protein
MTNIGASRSIYDRRITIKWQCFGLVGVTNDRDLTKQASDFILQLAVVSASTLGKALLPHVDNSHEITELLARQRAR